MFLNANPRSPEQRFYAETEIWARGYSHVLYSVFVLKFEGQAHLIVGDVIIGTHSQLASFPEMNYCTDKVEVFRVLKPLGERHFDEMLSDALAGMVNVGGTIYSFQKSSNNRFNTYFEESVFGDGKRKNAKILHIHGPEHELLLNEHHSNDVLDTIIKTGSVPYDGREELLKEAGLWSTYANRSGSHINITALTPATIMGSSSLKGGLFRLDISKSKVLEKQHVAVGYVIYKQSKSIERGRVHGDELQWIPNGDDGGDGYEMGRFENTFPGAVSAKVFLSYGDTIYDEWLIEDELAEVNTLAAVYGVYDGARTQLVEHLRGKGKHPGDDFEAAFSTLLTICGLSSIHVGSMSGMSNRDTVDAIASTRSGRLLVVECTIGDINNDNKLGKLDARYKHILTQLAEARVPVTASQRVIATAYTREQVEANLEDAGKLDIAVVTQDEIQEILGHLDGNITSDRIFDYIKRLIPFVRTLGEPDLGTILGLYTGKIEL